MLKIFYFTTLIIIGIVFCSDKTNSKTNFKKNKMSTKPENIIINREKAIQIAQENAAKFYSDLSVYNVEVKYDDDKWYVSYILKDTGMVGGGPHYVISAKTGEIDSFRFYQ